MNKTLSTAALLATLALLAAPLAGCNRGQKADPLAQDAPAPMAYDAQPFEPVEIESYQPQPQPQPQSQPQPQLYNPAQSGQDLGAPTLGGGTYTVQRGDTLWSIAKNYYGNGQRWTDIRDANPGLDPQKLPVGKTLVMP